MLTVTCVRQHVSQMFGLECMQAGTLQATLGSHGIDWPEVLSVITIISVCCCAIVLDKQRYMFLLLQVAVFFVGRIRQNQSSPQVRFLSVRKLPAALRLYTVTS